MKKNTIKAFTLVEMLIVIVIIGILIAALMPRMQSAQWRSRDVARKNDLAQLQTAIVTSQQDKWGWPLLESWARNWTAVQMFETLLTTAGMSSVPTDPLTSTEVYWLGNSSDNKNASWYYLYMVSSRNWSPDWWFVLMAKTEIEWWSNRAVCGETPDSDATNALKKWWIKEGVDITDIHPCTKMTKVDNCATANTCCDMSNQNDCKYEEDGQLRYIVTY